MGTMLNDEQRGRFCVVLVRARNSSNIGAAARAMRDFGFMHLRAVNEFLPPFEAARSAVDASEVMAGARVFATVAEAVADCTLVVGTTAVGERSLQHELLELPAAGEHHVSMNLGQAVAVCLYELVRGGGLTPPVKSAPASHGPADGASLERVTLLLNRVLEATEYTRRHAANGEPAQVRRCLLYTSDAADDLLCVD